MSKKKTPQEKKEASYEKDHYTFPWVSPQGFRKTWKKKKNYRNRVVRRKAKNLLHDAEGYSLSELGPEQEPLTSELFRKGLSKKRLRKVDVVNLREKVEIKKGRRERRGQIQRERRERLAIDYAARIVALERSPNSAEAGELLRELNMGPTGLLDFLREHPDWRARLRTKIEKLQKQQQLLLGQARLKQEAKHKWRSPTLRLPQNTK